MQRKNEYILILGVSSGFGKAIATTFAKEGYDIYGVHLDMGSAKQAIEDFRLELESLGIKAKFFNANAANDKKRNEIIDYISKNEDPHTLRVMIHSMAFGALKPFIGISEDDIMSKKQLVMTMDVMANSLVYWAQDIFKAGFFAENSKIFAMTSIGSKRVTVSYGAVSAAKAALESYVRQLGVELAPYKISTNAILAGVTDTPAARKIPGFESMLERTKKYNPFKQNTTPELVAKAILMLSNPEYYFINGQTIAVDGGENILNFAE
ncbi:MAG: SDR family oxidoreductase [Ignavibacteria bacterium]|jgi:enoyl-[acyl-carrier protein] reductase III|nr:SDR family oxidoreductase [Ignavibacteria bacterium]